MKTNANRFMTGLSRKVLLMVAGVGAIALSSCNTSLSENSVAATPDIPPAPPASSPATVSPGESPASGATDNSATANSAISNGSTTVAAAPGFRATPVVSGLEHPWGMAWLPDGAMLITERPGRLRIVRNGRLEPNPIAGIPDVLVAGQGGLMDVAVHPRFSENRLVYFTYSYGTRDANRTRVARAVLEGDRLQNLQVIFEVTQPKPGTQHFGSRLLWMPDNTLLVTIGDGGNPPVQLNGALIREQAQNRQSRLGKVIRINDDGSVPADNPFVNTANAEPRIWSYGNRNIQGIALDPTTGKVWATEHGARGGDELNLMGSGKNYGWPLVTYSREYSGGEISAERSRPGFEDPKTVWTPAIAPSGLAVYTGDRFPQWRGNLFAGGLVSRDIRRLTVDAAGNVVSQESIPIGQRVRDVRQGPDGLLYVLTDAGNGQLIRLDPTN